MQRDLYVLGHPVGHSKSPVMHNAAYAALRLDWHYWLMDCETQADAQAFIDARSWIAINVTMPYKPLAFASAHHRSVASELAGGANVLVNHDGALHADNTDGKGCVSYLQRCGVTFPDARVVVCGTGPTSLAIMHACVQAGAARVTLLGRDKARTQAVMEGYRASLGAVHAAGDAGAELVAGCYSESLREIADAHLIVDATPLGMAKGDPAPFDTSALTPGQTVFDVVYGHGVTRLVADARTTGCAAFDGAGMLVAQAVETVRDIAAVTRLFDIPASLDLFAIMARAAGFEELV